MYFSHWFSTKVDPMIKKMMHHLSLKGKKKEVNFPTKIIPIHDKLQINMFDKNLQKLKWRLLRFLVAVPKEINRL
jgi:hypothetical protein